MNTDAAQALLAIAQNPETARTVTAFGSQYFGGAGHNLVGLLGGDWLYYTRLENIAKLANGVRDRLKTRGIAEPQQVSLALGLPLLKEAADESRDEIRDLWERLLASAMDPSRSNSVRRSFIETVAQMERVDALVFRDIMEGPKNTSNYQSTFARQHSIRADEVMLSVFHLQELKCIDHASASMHGYEYRLTLFGRELASILRD